MTIRLKKILWGTAGTFVAVFPALLLAHYDGPDSGHAGAPGDVQNSCAAVGCHTNPALQQGGPVNSYGGSVTATFSSGSSYTPGGAPITITVTASDPVNTHFGFQMTARVGSTASSKTPQQAGSFNPGTSSPTASNPIVVLCSDSNFRLAAGCSSSAPYEYIEHFFTTYTAVYKTSQSYTFTWTPPATNVGNVNFYIAGNVVNYDGQPDAPDHVYTASYVLTPFIPFSCTNTTQPVITFVDSASGYGGYPYFASGSWLEIKGANLADPADPRLSSASPGQWTSADFNGVNAPTALDGVSVSIAGKPAYVWYLSPGQLNVQAPEDSASGSIAITVTNCKATSSAFTFARQALAPGLLAPSNYTANGTQYMVATFNSDGAYVLNTSTGASFGLNSRPAKPGDLIVAYGIGFGDVTPTILPGVIVGQSNALVNPVTISFGSTNAALVYAGLAGNFVGLYEFYITVPSTLANGDYQINVKQNGIAVPQTMFLTVHN
jgi:uncharacterized protein (TIGR03437 family)